jgi:hypothetical protein
VILWKTSHRASDGDITVTAPSSIDRAWFLHDQVKSASPDLLSSMLTAFINAEVRETRASPTSSELSRTTRRPSLTAA